MASRHWLRRQFGPLTPTHRDDRQQRLRNEARRRLRIEPLERRVLLCGDLGGDPSAVLPNETTGFSHTPGSGDYSAMIDLAQNDTQVTSVTVGAGEPSAQSTLRYVSPTGSGNGTQGSPWSLSQANSQLLAGDTALMLSGTYDGVIDPSRSGTPGNPITYKPAPGANVHLRAIGSDYAVNIGSNHILVEGLTVSRRDGRSGSTTHVANIIVFTDHVTVRNMHVMNTGDHICQARLFNESGIVARGEFVLIENNYVENMRTGIGLGTDLKGSFSSVIRGNTIADPVYDGIAIGNGGGAPLNHLIENNVIFGAMVSDGITFDGRNDSNPVSHLGINQVIVRNNAIFNSGENNIDLKATKNILIEGNFLWKNFGDNDGSNVLDIHDGATSLTNDENGGPGITKGGGTDSQDVIIRNNVSIDSNQATLALRGYKVYNNTFLNNRHNFNGPNQPASSPGARKPLDAGIVGNGTGPNAAILNNIIGDHGYEVVLRTSGSAAIDGNAYYNTFQTPRFSPFTDNYNWTSETFASWKSWLQTKSNFTGDEANSQVVSGGPSALFVNVPAAPTGDPAQFNFHLKSNSPAIDSGVFLTKTTSSGSGTTMAVADAGMFFDGYDITAGDTIQLQGQTQTATITNISGNTLTLNRALSWSSDTGVSLAYEGSSPDVGAIEFGSGGGGENIPPTAVDDSVTTVEGVAVSTGNLLANDTDPNPGDTLSVQSFTQAGHGTLFDIGNGAFAYLPDSGFTGTDSFTYVVSDGNGGTDTGTVNVTVTSAGATGPGGFESLGESLTLWLDADSITDVADGSAVGGTGSEWLDRSGTGNHATQTTGSKQPTWNAGAAGNGRAAIRFDGWGDNLDLGSANLLNVNTGFSSFFVGEVTDFNAGQLPHLLSAKASGVTNQMEFFRSNNSGYSDFVVGSSGSGMARDDNPSKYQTGIPQFFGVSLSGANVTANYRISADGTVNSSPTIPSALGTNPVANNSRLGASGQGNQNWKGNLAEAILFDRNLNTAEETIVNNYLSSKYNISFDSGAASSDLYLGDTIALGNYDFDVFGLAQVSNTTVTRAASAGFALEVTSGLTNGESLLAGHKTETNSLLAERWSRSWYVDRRLTGNETLEVSFDWSDAGLGAADSSFVDLLYSPTDSGTFSSIASGVLADDTVTFPTIVGITFASGYYTLGVAPTGTAGDFDTDGDVDGDDFLSWQRGSGSTPTAGDLSDWQDNFGAGTSAASATTAVVSLVAASPGSAVSTRVETSPGDALSDAALVVPTPFDLQPPSLTRPVVETAIAEAFGLGNGHARSTPSHRLDALAVARMRRGGADRAAGSTQPPLLGNCPWSSDSLDRVFERLGES